MPSRGDYDEAIRLARATLRVSDPELKEGQVDLFTQATRVGPVPKAYGINGGNAVVYRFLGKSGTPHALRCFFNAVSSDTQERYMKLGGYFRQHLPDITVPFTFYDPGIKVKDPPNQPREYPIIDMEWVEGETLLQRVDVLCQARDQAGLAALADQWVKVMEKLRQAGVAHGDLAAENVMIRQNGHMVLVDYDGVYIPSFAGKQVTPVGQVDYQHWDARQYDEWMDEFPALVIYTALRALQVQPDLWGKYITRNAQGKPTDTNLLFKHMDFKNPVASGLLRELEQMNEPRLKQALQVLKKACQQRVQQVRFAPAVSDPLQMAFEELEQAITADDDEQVVKLWVPPLTTYPAARRHVAQVEAARKRLEALRLLRAALQAGRPQQIAAQFSALVRTNSGLTTDERQQADLAQEFWSAYLGNDEEKLAATWEAIQQSPHQKRFVLTSAEAQRVKDAGDLVTALTRFREALKKKEMHLIAHSFVQVQQHRKLAQDERKRGELAAMYMAAFEQDEHDDPILAAKAEVENFQHQDSFILSAAQTARLGLAQRRREALVKFRLALRDRWIEPIAAGASLLQGYKGLTPAERVQLDLASRFAQACQDKNEAETSAIRAEIARSSHAAFFRFTEAQEQWVKLAQERVTLLEGFRRVLNMGTPRQVVQAFPAQLEKTKSLGREERKRLEAARNFVRAYDDGKDGDDEALVVASEALRLAFHRSGAIFSQEEARRVDLARRRLEALRRFRQVASVKGAKALDILGAYAAPLLDDCKNVTLAERQLLQAAQAFKEMYQDVRAAILIRDDTRLLQRFDKTLVGQFSDFTQEELNWITHAQTRQRLEHAYTQKKYRAVLSIAEELERTTGNPIADPHVALARRWFVAAQDPHQLQAQIQGEDLVATWDWPADALIQHVALVWRKERWPKHPEKRDREDGFLLIERAAYSQQNKCQLRIGRVARLYVQVYAALKEQAGKMDSVWYYSEGRDASARAEARLPCQVRYNLTKKGGTLYLEVETGNGEPLPELIIVRKAGNAPTSANDGDTVTRISGDSGLRFHTLLQLNVSGWPKKSVIRVFPANTSDSTWLTIVDSPVEVN
ncbi:MAG TPA: hypothetical protein VH540_07600 [Ktedonobacterales bacterium]|jgi:hypothetical protein